MKQYQVATNLGRECVRYTNFAFMSSNPWCDTVFPWRFGKRHFVWHHFIFHSDSRDSSGEVGSYWKGTRLVLVQNPGQLLRLTVHCCLISGSASTAQVSWLTGHGCKKTGVLCLPDKFDYLNEYLYAVRSHDCDFDGFEHTIYRLG